MSRRTLIPLIISIVCILLAGGANFITFEVLSRTQEESFLLAQEIRAAENKEERANRAQQTLKTISAQEEAIQQRLVSEASIVDFLETLEATEEDTGVEIEVVSVASDKDINAFLVNITVQGTFQNVMSTLGAIENLPVSIENTSGAIETVIRENEGSNGEWTASMSYRIKKQ